MAKKMIMFRGVNAQNFPPFEQVFRMEFPVVPNKPEDLAEVHILTGVNGTGKTRILCLLAALLGNIAELQRRLPKNTSEHFLIRATDDVKTQLGDWSQIEVGYNANFGSRMFGGFGAWVNQVPAFAYSGTAYISDSHVQALGDVPIPDRSVALSFSRPANHSGRLLQAIGNLLVQAGLSLRYPSRGRHGAVQIIEALERTLTEITDRTFRFDWAGYDHPTVSVIWGGTKLTFDMLPDGLRSIIGWMVDAAAMLDALLQGKNNPFGTEAVFLLDEVESQLHPVWQRRVLPAFQRLFPKAQIFAASHSPFAIASINHGWIHRLTVSENGKATAQSPAPASAGDSYISVLEDIMGLKEWYDPETEKLLSDFRSERDRAYGGDLAAKAKALELAQNIGKRSPELGFTMGREVHQMERQLSQTKVGSQ